MGYRNSQLRRASRPAARRGGPQYPSLPHSEKREEELADQQQHQGRRQRIDCLGGPGAAEKLGIAGEQVPPYRADPIEEKQRREKERDAQGLRQRSERGERRRLANDV